MKMAPVMVPRHKKKYHVFACVFVGGGTESRARSQEYILSWERCQWSGIWMVYSTLLKVNKKATAKATFIVIFPRKGS